MKRPYEWIEHTADVGVRVFGDDLKGLFSHAASAFFEIITDLNTIDAKETHIIEIEGEDLEDLLINWLNELLFLFETKGLVFKEFEIEEIKKDHLRARIRGEFFDLKKHPLKTCIKAVTYHQLRVEKIKEHWEAQIIFDI